VYFNLLAVIQQTFLASYYHSQATIHTVHLPMQYTTYHEEIFAVSINSYQINQQQNNTQHRMDYNTNSPCKPGRTFHFQLLQSDQICLLDPNPHSLHMSVLISSTFPITAEILDDDSISEPDLQHQCALSPPDKGIKNVSRWVRLRWLCVLYTDFPKHSSNSIYSVLWS